MIGKVVSILWENTHIPKFNSDIFSTKKSSAENGTVMLEFAFTALIFFGVILMGIDLTRVLFNTVTLQFSVAQTARWAKTADSVTSIRPGLTVPILGCHQGCERANEISYAVGDFMEAFSAGKKDLEIEVCREGVQCSPGDNDAGRPYEYVVISARKPVKLLFKNESYWVSASVLYRNEPFTS